jgi:uncharacterized protein YllA (UPF0747 family)
VKRFSDNDENDRNKLAVLLEEIQKDLHFNEKSFIAIFF